MVNDKVVDFGDTLVPRYVFEDDDNNTRRVCRASNVAVFIVLNFGRFVGKSLDIIHIRREIRNKLGIVPSNDNGDFRAHGDACGKHKRGLNLNIAKIGENRFIGFSLENLSICSRYILHWHEITGALEYDRVVKLTSPVVKPHCSQCEDLEYKTGISVDMHGDHKEVICGCCHCVDSRYYELV